MEFYLFAFTFVIKHGMILEIVLEKNLVPFFVTKRSKSRI